MRLTPLILFLSAAAAPAQQPLQQRLAAIAADAHGKVSIACSLPGSTLNCDLNPHAHAPMQSVFKLPLAITMLREVDKGRFSLDQTVRFLPSDRMPGAYSPLQDNYPNAGVDLPLREVLRVTVAESDNAGSEILLRLLGGTAPVRACMASLGVPQIVVLNGEREIQRAKDVQYRNYAEPEAFVRLLQLLADHSPLQPATAAFLDDVMVHATTGAGRMRAGLPAGTVLAHKTGSSGTDHGLTPATNDLGLITLPDGRRLALAIFVTDAHATASEIEAVMARLTKTVYEEASKTASAKVHRR